MEKITAPVVQPNTLNPPSIQAPQTQQPNPITTLLLQQLGDTMSVGNDADSNQSSNQSQSSGLSEGLSESQKEQYQSAFLAQLNPQQQALLSQQTSNVVNNNLSDLAASPTQAMGQLLPLQSLMAAAGTPVAANNISNLSLSMGQAVSNQLQNLQTTQQSLQTQQSQVHIDMEQLQQAIDNWPSPSSQQSFSFASSADPNQLVSLNLQQAQQQQSSYQGQASQIAELLTQNSQQMNQAEQAQTNLQQVALISAPTSDSQATPGTSALTSNAQTLMQNLSNLPQLSSSQLSAHASYLNSLDPSAAAATTQTSFQLSQNSKQFAALASTVVPSSTAGVSVSVATPNVVTGGTSAASSTTNSGGQPDNTDAVMNSMLGALTSTNTQLGQLSQQVMNNVNLANAIDSQVQQLDGIVTNWPQNAASDATQSVTYTQYSNTGQATTVTANLTLSQVQQLSQDMGNQLQTVNGTTNVQQLYLQNMMQDYEQNFQMLSQTSQADFQTSKAVIQNI